jgi:hypothetical protein
MILNNRWLFASFWILFIFAPSIGAQTFSVACTNPAGPPTARQPSGPIFSYGTVCIAGGGVAPYTWSIVNGQLPPGLTAQTDSQAGSGAMSISGQPYAAGPYSYTIQFTDSQNGTAGQTFSGTIAAANTACVPGSIPNFYPANPYGFSPSDGAGGTSPFRQFWVPVDFDFGYCRRNDRAVIRNHDWATIHYRSCHCSFKSRFGSASRKFYFEGERRHSTSLARNRKFEFVHLFRESSVNSNRRSGRRRHLHRNAQP